ncbi:MAG: hypothetical protein ABIG39_06135 [Candidatus Micrarchaeota archaeon]
MEKLRQWFHIGIGIMLLLLVWLAEREYVVLTVLCGFLCGITVLNLKLAGLRVPVIDELLSVFERPNTPPGYGAFWYAFGVLVIISFIQNADYVMAAILVLGISDGVSTIVGLGSSRRLPYNKNKTVGGSLGFAIVSLLSFVWIGALAIPFSIIGAFLEGVDLRFDDNLVISLFSVAFFLLVG